MRHFATVIALISVVSSPAVRAADVLLQPPPPVRRQGLPGRLQRPLCPELQRTIRAAVGGSTAPWSISVLDDRGQLLADLNGWLPRIPASNQKLISTAFALDRLGPDQRLRTQLLRHGDGSFELTGEGDPDLSIEKLQRLAMVALGQGGSRSRVIPGEPVRLMLRDVPPQRWWPSDWPADDRSYAYGAPITRLALTSNALHMAVMDPALRLQRVMQSTARQQGGQFEMVMVNSENSKAGQRRNPFSRPPQLLHTEESAPMHALLSLANTESHNFTAEVLLREGAESWDLNRALQTNTHWLQAQGVPMRGLRLRDGSGLSRANRVTSRTLAALLWRMAQHPLGAYYQASMAITGRRGTLRRYWRGTSLQGRFWGKTGTLRGVRAVSGILETTNGPRYVSMIANGALDPKPVMGTILQEAQRLSQCPSWSAALWQPVGLG
tara:strand:- start:7522 stop:8835 length:1314 start_codon:yes stop_codon:yes gene_type:complete